MFGIHSSWMIPPILLECWQGREEPKWHEFKTFFIFFFNNTSAKRRLNANRLQIIIKQFIIYQHLLRHTYTNQMTDLLHLLRNFTFDYSLVVSIIIDIDKFYFLNSKFVPTLCNFGCTCCINDEFSEMVIVTGKLLCIRHPKRLKVMSSRHPTVFKPIYR